MQDRDLRARFRQGDPDAVREIYRSHGRLVYAVAYRVLGDRGLAEEAPFAYKDVERVVNVVERAGLATRVAQLMPLGVVKG